MNVTNESFTWDEILDIQEKVSVALEEKTFDFRAAVEQLKTTQLRVGQFILGVDRVPPGQEEEAFHWVLDLFLDNRLAEPSEHQFMNVLLAGLGEPTRDLPWACPQPAGGVENPPP